MIKKVLKGAAWAKAPRLMFAAKNPRKAAVLKAVDWATGLVTPRRKRRSTGKLALQGLGAAAVALPLGLWVGRKVRGGSETTSGYGEGNGRQ
ncbi:MAG TPA: hypothetical protein VGR27_15465 [Longimicrobiaceae bacterium]|nr:hypothetical protein [Longimicrobiaceae bacterium]